MTKISAAKKTAFACILSLTVLAATQPALATDHAAHKGARHNARHMMMQGGMFDKLDANHDGAISKAEADAHFDTIDADHDGKVTKEEWKQHMKGMHEKMMGKRGMKNCMPGQKDSGKDNFSTLNQ